MDSTNLSVDDLLGVLYFRSSDMRVIHGYFNCINLLKPLLNTLDSQPNTSGFYLNIGKGFNSVRLSFFTNHESKTHEVINEFLKETSNVTAFDIEKPKQTEFSKYYGGDELRFRRFLCTYTKIGLDLLDFDVLFSRRLVAKYRLVYSPQKISCRPLFESVFCKRSDFFNQLSSSNKRQLWEDLNFWHPIPNSEYIADWTHMMVNMLLPGDWLYILKYSDLFLNRIPKQPITGKRRLEMLGSFSLNLPEEWDPEKQ